jgi:hypothetical protein
MSMIMLPQSVYSNFFRELDALGRWRISSQKQKKLKEEGDSFFVSLSFLYSMMDELEPEFFKPFFNKAILVMRDPSIENCQNLQNEVECLKAAIDKYKKSYPFSTGIGFILVGAMVLTLGISLLVVGSILSTAVVAPPLGLALCFVLMKGVGLLASIISIEQLCEKGERHSHFFNNKHVKRVQQFVDDITSEGLLQTSKERAAEEKSEYSVSSYLTPPTP